MKGKNGRDENGDNQYRQLYGQILLQHGAEKQSTEYRVRRGNESAGKKILRWLRLVCMATGGSQ